MKEKYPSGTTNIKWLILSETAPTGKTEKEWHHSPLVGALTWDVGHPASSLSSKSHWAGASASSSHIPDKCPNHKCIGCSVLALSPSWTRETFLMNQHFPTFCWKIPNHFYFYPLFGDNLCELRSFWFLTAKMPKEYGLFNYFFFKCHSTLCLIFLIQVDIYFLLSRN